MRMIHILIVDDEKLIRAGICKMVDQFFSKRTDLSYNLLESNNGRDAYRKCCSGYIDILITDIKMPAMSGLSLAKKVLNEQPTVHILAISGHQDYEYVRDMMKLGAFDYLLKPIDEKQLNDALEYFISHLTLPVIKGNTMYHEQQLIGYFFLKISGYKKNIEMFLKTHDLNNHMHCDIFFVKNDPLNKNQAFELYYATNDYSAEYPDIITLQGELNTWIIFCIHKIFHPEFSNSIQAYLESKGYLILSKYQIQSLDNAYSIHEKFQDMFYDIQWDEKSIIDKESFYEALDKVMLGDESFESASAEIRKMFATYQADHVSRSAIKKDVLDYLYRLMARDSDYIEFVSKNKFTKYDLNESLDDAYSLSGLYENVIHALAHLHSLKSKIKESIDDDMIVKAKLYIDQHYFEEIQLPEVAGYVHLHPNYFSGVFREKVGLTFREYLRKKRIEAAKCFILQDHISLYEIAMRVGYGDSSHFFRAFKKVTGMTPKIYKSSMIADKAARDQ